MRKDLWDLTSSFLHGIAEVAGMWNCRFWSPEIQATFRPSHDEFLRRLSESEPHMFILDPKAYVKSRVPDRFEN